MCYDGSMSRVEYHEIECKTALNRVHHMPFKWSVNPYVGCTHSCHYCYARAYYAKAEHGNADRDFETRILVKTNIADVLRTELARPRWMGEQVALGTATDCYQPIEGKYRLTRRALEVLLAHRNPVGLVTKSPLVLRDRDLLAALAHVATVRVFFTITTLDPTLWRQVESGTAPPHQRLRALHALSEAGVPTGVLLAPILPGLTDSEEQIAAVAAAAAASGAVSFGAGVLRLAPFVKEHYLGWLSEHYPDLLRRYERAYSGAYAPREYLARLDARVERVRARYGVGAASSEQRQAPGPLDRSGQPVSPKHGRQLSLAL